MLGGHVNPVVLSVPTTSCQALGTLYGALRAVAPSKPELNKSLAEPGAVEPLVVEVLVVGPLAGEPLVVEVRVVGLLAVEPLVIEVLVVGLLVVEPLVVEVVVVTPFPFLTLQFTPVGQVSAYCRAPLASRQK